MHVSPSEQCNMNRVIFYSGVNGIMVTASHKIAYGQVFSRGREARGEGGRGSMRLTDWLYNSSISLSYSLTFSRKKELLLWFPRV